MLLKFSHKTVFQFAGDPRINMLVSSAFFCLKQTLPWISLISEWHTCTHTYTPAHNFSRTLKCTQVTYYDLSNSSDLLRAFFEGGVYMHLCLSPFMTVITVMLCVFFVGYIWFQVQVASICPHTHTWCAMSLPLFWSHDSDLYPPLDVWWCGCGCVVVVAVVVAVGVCNNTQRWFFSGRTICIGKFWNSVCIGRFDRNLPSYKRLGVSLLFLSYYLLNIIIYLNIIIISLSVSVFLFLSLACHILFLYLWHVVCTSEFSFVKSSWMSVRWCLYHMSVFFRV
jgi:hypothetical protein